MVVKHPLYPLSRTLTIPTPVARGPQDHWRETLTAEGDCVNPIPHHRAREESIQPIPGGLFCARLSPPEPPETVV